MIQYRLGAFGFMSSEDVHEHGQTNAGLLDMRFALNWVQEHIETFGGNASRVTLGGESSGAGSVMLQAMAYGGREDHLFNNVRAMLHWGSLTDPRRLSPPARIPLLCTTTMMKYRQITIFNLQCGQDATMRNSDRKRASSIVSSMQTQRPYSMLAQIFQPLDRGVLGLSNL